MARVRVTIEKGVLDNWEWRHRPFLLGFVLAPVGGFAGTFPVLILRPFGFGDPSGIMLLGVIAGSLFALPVTMGLFPLLRHSDAPGFMFPAAGAGVGALLAGAFGLFLSGLVGGLVTGLIFMWAIRPAASTPEAPTEPGS